MLGTILSFVDMALAVAPAAAAPLAVARNPNVVIPITGMINDYNSTNLDGTVVQSVIGLANNVLPPTLAQRAHADVMAWYGPRRAEREEALLEEEIRKQEAAARAAAVQPPTPPASAARGTIR